MCQEKEINERLLQEELELEREVEQSSSSDSDDNDVKVGEPGISLKEQSVWCLLLCMLLLLSLYKYTVEMF